MERSEIEGLLAFLRAAERLKDTRRTSWTSGGERESVAQHSWRVCLMATLVAGEYPELDVARLLELCVVHDLGEAIRGDVPAVEQQPGSDKAAREREDLLTLVEPLPERLAEKVVARWDEYEAAESPEARLAKALDKLETILQHNQGANPPDFDYRFNLEYGRRYTAADPLIETIREIARSTTRSNSCTSGRGKFISSHSSADSLTVFISLMSGSWLCVIHA